MHSPEIHALLRSKTFRKCTTSVVEAVCHYDMIRPEDRILVGLSGGNDSMVLMHILHHLRRRAPFRFEVLSATVDMGFETMDIGALEAYCRAMDWPHETVPVAGAATLKEKQLEDSPCSFCSRLRRGVLHGTADRLGCNVIALGQHLDDLCVSLLMSLFRGHGLKTMGVHVPADGATKRLIRPLCFIPKAPINEMAEGLAMPRIKSCPFEKQLKEAGDRAFLEQLIADLDGRFNNIRGNMLASLRKVEPEHLADARFLPMLREADDTAPDLRQP